MFSLIICTYNRPDSVQSLLRSISTQFLVPNEILVIDGSDDIFTEQVVNIEGLNIFYHRVTKQERGLTKQRNIGISLVQDESEIICFLDDFFLWNHTCFANMVAHHWCISRPIGAENGNPCPPDTTRMWVIACGTI